MFQVTDKYELIGLYRIIMEAKFSDSPKDTVIPYSPVTADLSKRVINSLLCQLNESGAQDEANQWESWLELEIDRIEFRITKSRIEECSVWNEMDIEQKKNLLSVLLAPFSYPEKLAEELLEYGNEYWIDK